MDPDEAVNYSMIDDSVTGYVMIAKTANTESVVGIGIAETSDLSNLRYTDYMTCSLYYEDIDYLRREYDIETYRFLEGDNKSMATTFKVVDNVLSGKHPGDIWDILDILSQNNIFFTSLRSDISNNSSNLMDFVWNDNSIAYNDGYIRKRKFIRGIHRL